MIKKAFIYNPYWLSFGGGERYTASIAEFLISQGWLVDIYWPTNLADKIRHRFGINLSKAQFVTNDWTYKYDLAFWVSDGSLPASFAKKTLIHFQIPFTQLTPSISDRIKARLYTLVCNSRFTKSFIDSQYSAHSLVLYPPVDTQIFPPAKKTNTILYVGRFSRLTQDKNQLQLIKSFQKIEKKLKNWKLIIAGGLGIGHDHKFINSLSGQINKSQIELCFNPNLPTLKKLYGQAKIFWSAAGYGHDQYTHPDKVEHFGMTVVEAMSAGCVPIVSNLGGHREIVDNKSGFLWDQPSEMESLTVELIRTPEILSYLSRTVQARSKIFDKLCFQNSLQSIIG